MPSNLRRRVYEVLEVVPGGDRAARLFAVFIVTLILLNVAAVMGETVEPFGTDYREIFFAFEILSLAVFIGEYVVRVWACTADPRYRHPLWGRLRFAMTPLALVDLAAILPALLFVLDLRFLRVLRLLRLFKLGRYSESMRIMQDVFRSRGEHLLMALFLVFIALSVASSLMYFAERDAQPDVFTSIPATMWWGVVTLTTLGYGDVVPATPLGHILGGLTAILGIAVVALPVGILASGFMEEAERHRRRRGHVPCVHCGKDPFENAAAEAAHHLTGSRP